MNEQDKTALMPRVREDFIPKQDPWGEAPVEFEPTTGGHRARRSRAYAWLVPGLVMAVLGGVELGRPGLWADEFATWGMAGIPWRESVAILRYVDAVIAPYYALMHGWVGLVGTSDLALRAPSVAAMALAAALTGAIGGRLAGPRVGLLAGLLFAVLPSSSRFAQEARPYAMALFAATLVTYLFVRILQRPRFGWFIAYTVAVALLGLSHFVALLLLVGHGWVLLARRRRLVFGWSAAVLVGVLPVLPLVWLGNRQRHQVAWIGQLTDGSRIFLDTMFGAVLVAGVLAVLALFSLPLRYPSSVYTAWAVLPALSLFAVSQVLPLFLPRYLLFTLPAWALLAGAALGRVRPVWAVLVLVAVAAVGVPTQVKIRSSAGHEDATRELAAVVSRGYQPGDGVVYSAGDEFKGSGWVPRDTLAHYVPADRRPRDVFLKSPQRTGGRLLATECEDPDTCLGSTPRLWVIRLGNRADPLRELGDRKEDLVRFRYRQQQVWHPRNFTVALMVVK